MKAIFFNVLILLFTFFQACSKLRVEESFPCPECITNAWIYVPGGSFMMGSHEWAYEEPIHEVTLTSFQMLQYEVTFAEYERCVDVGYCAPSAIQKGSALDKTEFQSNHYCSNTSYPSQVLTCAVGSYPKNGLGIYDLTGNVWEWCKDGYEGYWYKEYAASEIDPFCDNEAEGHSTRGGCWADTIAYALRVAHRGHAEASYHSMSLGFRCVRNTPSL